MSQTKDEKPKNYYNVIRANIKKYRIEKGYTQESLSYKVNMSKDYLSEIESPTKNKSFSIDILGKIADALEVDIKCFFDENDSD